MGARGLFRKGNWDTFGTFAAGFLLLAVAQSTGVTSVVRATGSFQYCAEIAHAQRTVSLELSILIFIRWSKTYHVVVPEV
tara:strand:- start:162 stop:401 length:240 start_codon:yes stop_codon:yes gene_type:complete